MVDVLAWLQTWSAVIGAIGSLLLSGLLALLYWKQQGLLTRELNREVRKNHSETLRKRVRAWHGAMDELANPDSRIIQDTNLPTVNRDGVEPAGSSEIAGHSDDSEFRVVPKEIEDDRYLQDLLENHAPKLRELKEDIEEHYEQFNECRQSFVESHSGDEFEDEEYTAQSLDHFSVWAFEQAVSLHRGKMERQDLKDVVEDHFSLINPNPATTFYYSPYSGRQEIATYEAESIVGERLNTGRIAVDRIKDHHLEEIENIDDSGIYEQTVEAAQILDEVEETVTELQWELVEYEGHPLYHGDCSYIDEASVEAPSFIDKVRSLRS